MDPVAGSVPPNSEIEQEIAALYRREATGILRYAAAIADSRETACDALQEAFFRFFLSRSAGREIQSPKAWLFRVAHNYVLDQRKAGSRNEIGCESLLNLPCPANLPDTDYHRADLMGKLML